jgi:hypothetical protein
VYLHAEQGTWRYFNCVCNLQCECLTKEALDGLGDFNIGRQIIQTVKYADDLVLMAEEETVLQSMIDKLIETGR